MMKRTRYIIICLLFTAYTGNLYSNGLSIGSPTFNPSNNTLSFTISWLNSWNLATAPSNYDAVWIFVKRQSCTNPSLWSHAYLSTNPANFNAVLTAGGTSILQVDPVSDSAGVFVHLNTTGTYGIVNSHTITLQLTGSTNPYIFTAPTDNFKVFGIEMVYVPQGSFYIGDGSSSYAFTNMQITSSIQSAGIGVSANYIGNAAYGCSASLPSSFPLGYNGFYCMKTEVCQGQITDFLNTLTYTQQQSLVGNFSGLTEPGILNSTFGNTSSYRNHIYVGTIGVYNSLPAIYIADSTSSTAYNPAIACNYLTWSDLTAYLAWAALRPMTEFEFEKACRGPNTALSGEYPWGNATVNSPGNFNTNYGKYNEVSANSGTATTGLCNYNNSPGNPGRVGFAATATSTSRISAGATYYGILDMAGNTYEQCIGGGGYNYATFTNINGNGTLTLSGAHGMANWPSVGGTASGTIIRGGSFWSNSSEIRTSDRTYYAGTTINSTKDFRCGGRGVRTF